MGMYTEFYFRANIKDGPVAVWLNTRINENADWEPFEAHPFFGLPRWDHVLIGGGGVYQESRAPIFRRKHQPGGPYANELVIASSLKNYGSEIDHFVTWISPHLDMPTGEFLGYALYEDTDTYDDSDQWREHPTLYFRNREPVIA